MSHSKKTTCLFQFYAVLFFLCGVAFIAVPNLVIDIINQLGGYQTYFTELDPGTDRFFLVLTFSMMMMIAYASYMVAKNREALAFINILMLSKIVSSLTYLFLLFFEQRAFAYLLGFLVDGVLFVSIFWVRKKYHVSG